MPTLTNQAGLSITEDKVQLVEIVYKQNAYYLENVDEEYFEESLIEDTKESKFIHILQNAFNELILRKPLSSSKISITIPTSYFKIFEIPADKNLTKNDLNDYIKWELSKLFPIEKKDYYTFQKIVLDSLTYESSNRILVYAIPINILKRMHKFCLRNSLQLKYIDSAHTSSTGLFQNDTSSSIKLSAYIENNHISVLLFSDNNLVFEKNKNYKTVPEISSIIASIIEEINDRKLISKDIDKIFFFGNSVTSELKNSILSSTNLVLGEANPFNQLEINPDLNENKFITEHSAKFSAATSIALRIGS
jgi:Tfp pilus assembly PilM family ATPase